MATTARTADTRAAPGARDRTVAPSERPPLKPRTAILYAVLIFYGIFSLAPFILAFLSSFKTYGDIVNNPASLVPQPITGANYQQILGSNAPFPHYIFNSLVYAITTAVLNVVLASMAGYAFGRLEFPGKNVLFALTLAVLMIPTQLILIPKFLVVNALGLANTFGALIIPAMVTPTSVFLMTQFMKSLPHELEESAMIDGAGRFRAFWQIILPLTKPAITAVALFQFQGAWNDFIWPLIVMSSQDNYTLTVGLSYFKGVNFIFYNLLLAGAAINIAPLVVLFFIFQRYFVQGISTAGLAGR